MTPLEKAARALAAAEGHFPWENFRPEYHETCYDRARAVLMAVREPAGAPRFWPGWMGQGHTLARRRFSGSLPP